MRFGSIVMGTQIATAKAAAAIVGLLIVLALSRDVAAQPAELRVLSSAAPRSVLNEMSPVFYDRPQARGRICLLARSQAPDRSRRSVRRRHSAPGHGRRSYGAVQAWGRFARRPRPHRSR